MAKPPLTNNGNLGRYESAASREAEKQLIEIKKAKAQSMVFRHLIEKKDYATCWFEVFPDSDCTRTQAKKQAYRLIKWFRLNFPTAIRHLLYMRGMDDSRIIDLLEDQFSATTPLKKGTRKWTSTNEDGDTVQHEEIDYIQIRDNKSFNEGVRNLITLHGYHGRALDTTPEDEQAKRTMRNVTEPSAIVEIGMVEKLPDDEWQRRYQATIEESNADEKANAMLRDLEKRVAEREAQERTHKKP